MHVSTGMNVHDLSVVVENWRKKRKAFTSFGEIKSWRGSLEVACL